VAVSRVLSRSQLETLARHGEERTAAIGEGATVVRFVHEHLSPAGSGG
jgi:hypothetical protein